MKQLGQTAHDPTSEPHDYDKEDDTEPEHPVLGKPLNNFPKDNENDAAHQWPCEGLYPTDEADQDGFRRVAPMGGEGVGIALQERPQTPGQTGEGSGNHKGGQPVVLYGQACEFNAAVVFPKTGQDQAEGRVPEPWGS